MSEQQLSLLISEITAYSQCPTLTFDDFLAATRKIREYQAELYILVSNKSSNDYDSFLASLTN